MNQKMRNSYTFILTVAFVAIFGIAVAYAALSSTLTITMNKVTQGGLTWNVAFDTTGTPVAAKTVLGTGDTGRSCGTAALTANSITVADTELSKPGDGCIYEFTIKNTGGIDAKLDSVVPTAPTSITCNPTTNASDSASATMTCGNLVYTLSASEDDSTKLTIDSILSKTSGTKKVYLIVKFKDDGTINSSDVVQSGAKFTVTYGQN